MGRIKVILRSGHWLDCLSQSRPRCEQWAENLLSFPATRDSRNRVKCSRTFHLVGVNIYLHALHAAAVLHIAQLLRIAGEDGGSLEAGEGLHAAGLRGSDAGWSCKEGSGGHDSWGSDNWSHCECCCSISQRCDRRRAKAEEKRKLRLWVKV